MKRILATLGILAVAIITVETTAPFWRISAAPVEQEIGTEIVVENERGRVVPISYTEFVDISPVQLITIHWTDKTLRLVFKAVLSDTERELVRRKAKMLLSGEIFNLTVVTGEIESELGLVAKQVGDDLAVWLTKRADALALASSRWATLTAAQKDQVLIEWLASDSELYRRLAYLVRLEIIRHSR